MSEQFLSEVDLAARWAMSSKTLTRWRTVRRGPPFVKLGKVVRYAMSDILEFERNGLRKENRTQELAEFAKENPGVRLIIAGNRAEKVVRDLRTQKRDLMKRDASPEEIKRIDDLITLRMRQFNERVASVM